MGGAAYVQYPTSHLGRKIDTDSIFGIRMDVRARLGVRFGGNTPIQSFLCGERHYFLVGFTIFTVFGCQPHTVFDPAFLHPERRAQKGLASWVCRNRLGSAQSGIPEA